MIRTATASDTDAIWSILEPVIRAGETYALDRDMSREDALSFWMGSPKNCFVDERDGTVVGTYYLTRNHAGGGGHVCNCGYMVAESARGQGVARAMCKHSLVTAREQGFAAMQFNFVVSTNVGAIGLWQSMGFTEAGRIPAGFDHPAMGRVDALIMFREL